MPTFRLRIARQDYDDLRELVLSALPREAAAFALAGVARSRDVFDVLVRRPVAIPDHLYAIQEQYRLHIAPQALNGLAALCEANGLGFVLCHSHPEDGTPYSTSDDAGEARIVSGLRSSLPARAPTASLLFTPNGVTGRVWVDGSEKPTSLSEIMIVGDTVERRDLGAAPGGNPDVAIYDRQVRAFGAPGQAALSRSKVAIVGVGGTGSPCAEQLVRLGVQDILLIDPDEFQRSNVTRVYGSFSNSHRERWTLRGRRRQMKVDVVATHLRRINPEARIIALASNVAHDDAAKLLTDLDAIFLCTDDHWGRAVVNQLAYQYLIPAINLGARITSSSGRIEHAGGVVDVLRPDVPCLWCRQFLRPERIAAESMPEDDRKALEHEGYVEGLGDIAPSVVNLTTVIAGLAVSVYLQLLTGYAGDWSHVHRFNYDALALSLRRGASTIADECVCRKVRGFGDLRSRGTMLQR